MRIDRLRLKNFRCFDDFEMEFSADHNVHVLIAENMAGKSALLRALRVGLDRVLDPLPDIPDRLKLMGEDHLREQRVGGRAALQCTLEMDVRVESERGEEVFPIFARSAGEDFFTPESREKNSRVYRWFSEAHGALHSSKFSMLPLLFFQGAAEQIPVKGDPPTTIGIRDEQITIERGVRSGYRSCLHDYKAYWEQEFLWFIQYNLERTKITNGQNADSSREILEGFTQNFLHALRIVFDDPGIEASWEAKPARSHYKDPVDTLGYMALDSIFFEWTFFMQGQTVNWGELSDGFRYLILLVAKLAVRAVFLNWHFHEDIVRRISGVVLIDELGMHMHPELQNKALHRLSKAFPKVQFIATTHSPMLLNGLKKEQVHILEVDSETGRRTVRHPSRDIVGMGAEGILREVFGLESTFDDDTRRDSKRYAELSRKAISSRISSSERDELSDLTDRLGAITYDGSLHDPLYKRFLLALDQRMQATNGSSTQLPTDEEIAALVDELVSNL